MNAKKAVKAPKGLLEAYLLSLCSRYPISGTEALRNIERLTEGEWKPSPGSIYPLIKRLKRRGLIMELEGGQKTYIITDDGRLQQMEIVKQLEVELRVFNRLFDAVKPR
ncbi:MAG: PadR family transcriptional regulator [Nitrososphaerota archaeon]|jgi:DNA-binding PadR family transcriptional regulator|nr:PadR family transcriptional regulator [Nitrososphaerota archaeon]MDG7041068.1 PadR family transcriptional regulator [Nitrososphaerota archaeon]MDG7042116.1 PadR family transcriptional regulator [Nitrososphaerota archaeon]MDG7043660.1 PadR family transcriptional regulator [Nitrososphaerota archaeon]MDG7046624.1 PadR family transcriptional regulator [Nitrososphaerota archaeon]